jgi:hypothetical protein
LQAVAMVVGVLLLLVTTSDLMGMPPQPAEWLSESEAPARQMDFRAAPPPEAAQPAPAPAMESESGGDAALEPSSLNPDQSFRAASNPSEGTTDGGSASQEVLEDAETASTAGSVATSAALAAVTQAVPTPAAGLARSPETTDDAGATASSGDQPSRLRLAQLVLAFALAWLVVSIVGLRWVRGLRRAQD